MLHTQTTVERRVHQCTTARVTIQDGIVNLVAMQAIATGQIQTTIISNEMAPCSV